MLCEGHVFHIGTGAEFSDWLIWVKLGYFKGYVCVFEMWHHGIWLQCTGVSEELAYSFIWVGDGSSKFLCNVYKLYQVADVMSQKTEIIFLVTVVRIWNLLLVGYVFAGTDWKSIVRESVRSMSARLKGFVTVIIF